MRVVIHPAASREAGGAVRWYRERRPSAAVQFRAALRDAIDRIRRMPLTWPESGDVQIARIRKFPYHVVYRYPHGDANTLLVVAIAHDKRRGEYWRARLRTRPRR